MPLSHIDTFISNEKKMHLMTNNSAKHTLVVPKRWFVQGFQSLSHKKFGPQGDPAASM